MKNIMQLKMTKTLVRSQSILFYIVASVLLLYFIYEPAIHILYYAGDDYRYAFGGADKSCGTDDGFYFMLTLGRPIQAYLDCLNYKFAYTLERMSVLRLIAVCLMGCGMGMLAQWFRCLGFSFVGAFLAAGCFFLLPHTQVTVAMGATSVPVLLILAIVSYACVRRAHTYTGLLGKDARRKENSWIALSGVLILCSLMTYPAMSFIFVSLILTNLLFSKLVDWQTTRRDVLRETTLFCAMCIFYFVGSYCKMHYFPQAPVTVQYQIDNPNFNMLEVFDRFLLLANLFNKRIWDIFPFGYIAYQGLIMIVVLVGGIAFAITNYIQSPFYKHNQRRALVYLFQAAIAVFALLILSSAFFLVIPTLDLGDRLRYGSVCSLLALLIWAVYQWSTIYLPHIRAYAICVALGVFFMIQGSQEKHMTTAYAIYWAGYLNDTKMKISHYLADGNKLRRIHFTIPKTDYPYDRFFLTNGALVQLLGHGNYALKWCSLPRGAKGKEKDHQQEAIRCIEELPKNGIAVTYNYSGEPYKKTKNMLLLDKRYEGSVF